MWMEKERGGEGEREVYVCVCLYMCVMYVKC